MTELIGWIVTIVFGVAAVIFLAWYMTVTAKHGGPPY